MIPFTMIAVEQSTVDVLRLTLISGLGPILIHRCLASFGSVEAVLRATPASLANIRGIGRERARQIVEAIPGSEAAAANELEFAAKLGVTVISALDRAYPPLLRQIPDPPPILYVRGAIDHATTDQYTVALVGSRSCTQYGREQAERFAAALAGAGLTVVSGGARGIDTAAHRGALRVGGRTVAVLGCGLAHVYPPDNSELFQQIAAGPNGASGAVVSELPLRTPPSAENFPARNRIISGLSLGVVVIEAGRRSGALITARVANEDHGREVYAVPGRVDSPSSEGTLDLIKQGGAGLVMSPADVIESLENRARHQFDGTFAALSADPKREPSFFESAASPPPSPPSQLPSALSESQRTIMHLLSEPRTVDELIRSTGLEAARVMSDVTILEVRRVVVRSGTHLSRARS